LIDKEPFVVYNSSVKYIFLSLAFLNKKVFVKVILQVIHPRKKKIMVLFLNENRVISIVAWQL